MKIRSLSVVGLCFLLMVGLSNKINAEDILTAIPDGRLVILHDDGTWEFSQSSDDGNIALSVTSLLPTKDADGYDVCEVTLRATNRTEFKFKGLGIYGMITADATVVGAVPLNIGYTGLFGPGDTVETEKIYRVVDAACEDIDTVTVDTVMVMDKRSVKGKKFSSDQDAQKFVSDLVSVSYDHDNAIVKLRVEVP